MISLALSLALASSGICNPLQKCNLELEARVGIGPPNSAFLERRPKNSVNVRRPRSSRRSAVSRLHPPILLNCPIKARDLIAFSTSFTSLLPYTQKMCGGSPLEGFEGVRRCWNRLETRHPPSSDFRLGKLRRFPPVLPLCSFAPL